MIVCEEPIIHELRYRCEKCGGSQWHLFGSNAPSIQNPHLHHGCGGTLKLEHPESEKLQ